MQTDFSEAVPVTATGANWTKAAVLLLLLLGGCAPPMTQVGKGGKRLVAHHYRLEAAKLIQLMAKMQTRQRPAPAPARPEPGLTAASPASKPVPAAVHPDEPGPTAASPASRPVPAASHPEPGPTAASPASKPVPVPARPEPGPTAVSPASKPVPAAVHPEPGPTAANPAPEPVPAAVHPEPRPTAASPASKPVPAALRPEPGPTAANPAPKSRSTRAKREPALGNRSAEKAAPLPVAHKKKRHLAWLITAIISAAAAAGAGIAGGVTTLSGDAASEEHDRAKFDRMKTQQVVLYGAAGGLGAIAITTLVLYLVTGQEMPAGGATKEVTLGPGFGRRGAVIQWRF